MPVNHPHSVRRADLKISWGFTLVNSTISARSSHSRRRAGRMACIARATERPDFHELHRVRIAVKRLRYILEFVVSLGTKPSAIHLNVLVPWQGALGCLNDLVASEAILARNARRLGKCRDAKLAREWIHKCCRQTHARFSTCL
jgi:CHAD domain-containing protein